MKKKLPVVLILLGFFCLPTLTAAQEKDIDAQRMNEGKAIGAVIGTVAGSVTNAVTNKTETLPPPLPLIDCTSPEKANPACSYMPPNLPDEPEPAPPEQ